MTETIRLDWMEEIPEIPHWIYTQRRNSLGQFIIPFATCNPHGTECEKIQEGLR